MKTIHFIGLLAGCLLAASCEKEQITPEIFDIPLDQEFTIGLESNWSTGYHWSWVNKMDISVVDSTGHSYISGKPPLGNWGTEKWFFQAIQKGEEILEFEYQAPGMNGEEPAIERKEILVRIY